jgi:6-phosphofructokinase 1
MGLLRDGRRNRLVVMQHGRLTDVDLTEAAGKQRLVPPDHPLIAAARSVYTSFGDDAGA